jgi:hypothetical protein
MLLDEDQRDARPIVQLIPVRDVEMEPGYRHFDWIFDESEFRLV